jgi:FkbM family methyltransferase
VIPGAIAPMEKYSQNQEQSAILAAFAGRVGSGYKFLDIGAFHAKQLSNTRALFELGWSGVMVEPSPTPFAGLVEEYGKCERIKLINAAVGFAPGAVEMYVTADAVSTFNGAIYEKWRDKTKFDGKHLVECVTLEQIYDEHGTFDFINIDTEGMSADLLLHRVLSGPLPHCICVEHDERIGEIIVAATEKGYFCTYGSGENLVLVRTNG